MMNYHTAEAAPCAPLAPRRIYRIRRETPAPPVPSGIVKRILRDAVVDIWLLDGSREGRTVASCLDEAEMLVDRLEACTLDAIAAGDLSAQAIAVAIADAATTH